MSIHFFFFCVTFALLHSTYTLTSLLLSLVGVACLAFLFYFFKFSSPNSSIHILYIYIIYPTWFYFVPRLLRGILVLLLLAFPFLPIILRLFDLGVRSSARSPVVLPPRVSGRRRPVHRPLHVAEERLAGPTRAVTAPPVLPVHVHLVVEGVINLIEKDTRHVA